ncbi:fimbrial protein [Chimaeribacter coloradensis]|uniref:Fimbrial protein n=1 Tax=Chimaeribacter coloradensis TaxID=2060068 RepID=A0A2N5EBA2_9GAMM|nr:fimbrial protein [Chimaeribacter coloradensis]PLR39423.1 fimbrial protein [Chimaeribacter coloradensis]
MKMKKNIFAVSALALALGSSAAYAGDTDLGLITFDGAVTDTTCKITTNNGVEANNITISLPVVKKADVEAATIATRGVGAKEFELKLTGCPDTYDSAKATFTSQQFAELSNGTLKADPTVAGAAQNVSLALFNNTSGDQSQIKIGDMNATQVADITTGEGMLAFMVSYVPSADWGLGTNDIVAGKVNTNTTFTMSYE